MDIISFVRFTFNTRYMTRWIYGGLILYIPVLNFFSLGFLSKASRLFIIGGMGLPTWQDRYDTWIEGIKLLFIFILYGAIPFFMFSCGFFLTTLTSFTAFFGNIIIKLSYVVLLICSFFLPFAFAVFAEKMDFKNALEFENIIKGIKEVIVEYTAGYIGVLILLYICMLIIRIPYIGFIASSVLTYYVFLISSYYFTELYKKTTLTTLIIPEESGTETPGT
ncbi:MAG: hypothetical protein A4E64_01995 [Syntrophorhabdus sp. PtaU1.Bin058]|nr:MAG: hypothetical protein A4E64_01995 [Syntrophorhabdus sp. PtaU1.Bin058]